MATIRQRNKGWMLDYYREGERIRIQINNKEKAVKLRDSLNAELSNLKDKKRIKKLFDTI